METVVTFARKLAIQVVSLANSVTEPGAILHFARLVIPVHSAILIVIVVAMVLVILL